MNAHVNDYCLYCHNMRNLSRQAIEGNMVRRRDALRIMDAMAEQNPTFAAKWTINNAIKELSK